MSTDQRKWPDTYSKTAPTGTANWRWVELWELDNPNPGGGPNFDEWYVLYMQMHERAWVADMFPQADVWDWPDRDITHAYQIIRRHRCGVCGRWDDAGCVIGC